MTEKISEILSKSTSKKMLLVTGWHTSKETEMILVGFAVCVSYEADMQMKIWKKSY